jgi:probable H4MPT-linked C1 transfer pathway protein
MWEHPEQLADVLAELLSGFGDVDGLAVTMTGELADCFDSKAEGVDHILGAAEQVAAGRPVRVWQTVGEFVTPAVAREFPRLTAAANWHALATWIGRAAPDGNSLLIDVGSTTTDIIPLEGGVPLPQGRTDVERLVSGELVYSGVRRTPLSAVAHAVPFRGRYCPLASENFACALDVYLWLGELPENADETGTADGKPATRQAALVRLARMLCCDLTEFGPEDADALSNFLADVQRQRMTGSVDRVVKRMEGGGCRLVVVSGAGEFLGRRVIAGHRQLSKCPVMSLAESMGPAHSEAACACALARLAGEERFR